MPTTYAIPDGRTVMAATLYTGTGAALTVSNAVNGVSFQPDFVWLKSRSSGGSPYTNHVVVDIVRGAGTYGYKNLNPNLTDPEYDPASGNASVTSLNSNGFTLGANANTNTSTMNVVGWQWKAGGTSASNTNGTITSTVSAGATQGFSVVTYTASSSASTIGHGLGVAPSMIIQKNRDAVSDWGVYHISVGATKFLKLNSTDVPATNSIPWNDTTPTSTVFSIGTGYTSGNKYVAYCFAAVAGYSAFGSYTGNGSTDGTFVYLGFRPRWLMIKEITNNGYNWFIIDASRKTYNVNGVALFPNTSGTENDDPSGYGLDMLSNGFKLRNSSTASNGSGSTYIYMAFAENPFKYANAR